MVEMNAKVALVTGGDSGLGRATVNGLASLGYHVFIAGLPGGHADAVIEEIRQSSGGSARVEFLPLDLGDLDSVRACAQAFLDRDLPLHLLINNAGVAGLRGKTASGFEMTFGVCHVGHFALTQLLLERLQASAPARIINVSSRLHRKVKRIDFEALRRPNRSFSGYRQYRVAKLATLLHARELARRLAGTGVISCAVHPGTVATNIWQNLPRFIVRFKERRMLTAEQGAATTLYCATAAASEIPSGAYFDKCTIKTAGGLALDDALALELWERSESWISQP